MRIEVSFDGTVTEHEDAPVIIYGITPEQLFEKISNDIQLLLDAKAQEKRYDNMVSARSYAGFVNPFQAEAQSLAVWAANCWVVAGQIEADVKSGTRPIPTVDEVLAELPTL